VLQKASRSSQLRSGSGFVSGGGLPSLGVEGAGGALQVPRSALLSFSIQLTLVPPMHEVCPQTSVRRSPFFSTTQVQSVPAPHAAAIDESQPATTSQRARISRRMLES
jgi:hypothetical protein